MADGTLAAGVDAPVDIQWIAHALRRHWSVVSKRANKEGWAFIEQPVRGGRQRLYALVDLPPEVQTAVRHANAVAAAQAVQTRLEASPDYQAGQAVGRRIAIAHAVDEAANHRARVAGMAAAAGLTGKSAARMNARLDALVQLDSFALHQGLGITAAMEAFCGAWAAGEVGTDSMREALGEDISPASLRRWRKTVKTQGAAALAGAYGNRAGSGLIDGNPELLDFAVGSLASTPHMGGRHLHRAIAARFGEQGVALPTVRSVQRWLAEWKAKNHQVFMALANPDEWKNKRMLAIGDADGDVSRLNERWEFDSTPGDLELLDGRHNIVGIIDVWSRRVLLHVSKTSSAESVCQALRRALLEWGTLERAKLDNGKDYVSDRVQRVFHGLGVEVQLSPPFSPWKKPHIERLFGTFSHDLLELLPGYLGHNVAAAQALRASQSFADRLFKKNTTTQLRLTAAELQAFCDRWVRDIYAREPRKGLGGMSVFERVASSTVEVRMVEDVRALDVLMAEAPDGKGLRRVGKKGLRVDGLFYAAPELGALVGEEVRVLYDAADMGRVVVYHDDAFACIAECPEVLGTSRAEVANEAKARQTKAIQEKRRELKALGRKAKTRDIAFEILDAKARAAQSLAALPSPSVAYITPALDAAGEAAAALDAADQPPEMRPLTQADIDLVHRMNREVQQQDDTEEGRFRRAIRLLAQAEPLDQVNAKWLAGYRGTPEFTGRWMIFEDFGGEAFGLGTDYDHLRPTAQLQGEY